MGVPRPTVRSRRPPDQNRFFRSQDQETQLESLPHVQIICPFPSFLSTANDPHEKMEREEPKLKFWVRPHSLQAAKQSGNKSTGSPQFVVLLPETLPTSSLRPWASNFLSGVSGLPATTTPPPKKKAREPGRSSPTSLLFSNKDSQPLPH